jgi:hypothetical protein
VPGTCVPVPDDVPVLGDVPVPGDVDAPGLGATDWLGVGAGVGETGPGEVLLGWAEGDLLGAGALLGTVAG